MTSRKMMEYLILLFLIYNVQGSVRVDPLVEAKVGLIRGLRATDGDYSMFLGIPFAKVDEDNPFGPSAPYPPFEDTFEAYDDSAICPQIDHFTNAVVGTLDCLHLNIYVPTKASSQSRLPVLVWIHGGAFMTGFSGRYVYGPKFLVKHDVILVTLNYRVGAYGFICLDNPKIPGNQGLKDQLAGLRWIKDNIEAFGGDTSKITIFGESAGSVSVDLHYLYDQENLFSKVIMQSGSSLTYWAVEEPDRDIPIKLSQNLGFPTNNTDEAIDFLTTVNTHLIVVTASELGLYFRPCVENEFENVERYIAEYPFNLNMVKNIPILLGYNSDEYLVFLQYENDEPKFYENYVYDNVFSDSFDNYFTFEGTYLSEMEAIARHFYIGDEDISKQSERGLIDFCSDFLFVYPAERSIQKYIHNGVKTIFHYVFSYTGERNYYKSRLNMTKGGAGHADEISYLFDVSFMRTQAPTAEEQTLIDRMTTLWTNFAKFGDPTPDTNDLLPVKWTPVTEDTVYYLDIDQDLTLKTRPFNDRVAFWELFYMINEKYQKAYKERGI